MESHPPSLVEVLFKISVVLFLVLLNGFFVAAEFAIVKVRASQIATLAKRKHRRARVATEVIQRLDAYLSATQLGITLASLALGWIGEPFVAHLIDPFLLRLGIQSQTVLTSISFSVAFAIITLLHIVIGELCPKSLAIQRAQSTALWVALPLTGFYRLFYPAIWALNGIANWVLRSVGIEPATEIERAHSEEELRLLLAQTSDSTKGSSLSRLIQLNAFTLKHLKARNIMLPRNKVVALFTENSLEENLRIARESRHTRFPVCKESLDHVLGMIHAKDLLWHIDTLQGGADLEKMCREILFVPDSVSLEILLNTFLEKRCHMAIIVDEFGGTLGMVTLEDVIEELVGEIQDEFDMEQPPIHKINDREYLIEGATPLHDVEEAVGIQLSDNYDATTLGGYVVNRWGEIPVEGTKWTYSNLKFEIKKVEKLRVSQVLVKVLETSPSSSDSSLSK
ncbi:MAG: hemolysin family protein [Acidobacteriota bacterium]